MHTLTMSTQKYHMCFENGEVVLKSNMAIGIRVYAVPVCHWRTCRVHCVTKDQVAKINIRYKNIVNDWVVKRCRYSSSFTVTNISEFTINNYMYIYTLLKENWPCSFTVMIRNKTGKLHKKSINGLHNKACCYIYMYIHTYTTECSSMGWGNFKMVACT